MIGQERKLPNGRTIRSINRNETEYLYKEIFEDQAYLFPDAAPLAGNPVIFDIGANIGVFALFATERWPDSRIICFEPVPEVFTVLAHNMAGVPGVVARNVAVGATTEVRHILYYPQYTILSGFSAEADSDRATVERYIRNVTDQIPDDETRQEILAGVDEMLAGRFEQRTVPVRVETLVDVVAELGTDRIDLLKIDVEGAEIEILDGMDDAVWRMVGSAVVEIADKDGALDTAETLFRGHDMRTRVRQLPEYRGTDLYMLFAER